MTEIDKIYKDLSNIQYGSNIFKGVWKQGSAILVEVSHQLYSGYLNLFMYGDTKDPECIRVCGTGEHGMDLFIDVDISRFRDELGYTFRTSTLTSILKARNTLSDLISSGRLHGLRRFLKGIDKNIQHPDLYIQSSAEVGICRGVSDEILEYVVEAIIPRPALDKSGTVVDKFSLTCNNMETIEINFKTSIERICNDENIGIEWIMNSDKITNFCRVDKPSYELGLSQDLPGVHLFSEVKRSELQYVYNKFNNDIV